MIAGEPVTAHYINAHWLQPTTPAIQARWIQSMDNWKIPYLSPDLNSWESAICVLVSGDDLADSLRNTIKEPSGTVPIVERVFDALRYHQASHH